jgi:hypothetical protein
MTPFELQTNASARQNILTRAIKRQEEVREWVGRGLRVPVKDRESEHDHAEDEGGGGRSHEARHTQQVHGARCIKERRGRCVQGG